MPTYIRPRVAIIEEGGGLGSVVMVTTGVAVVVAVVAFLFAHVVLLAVCAAAFVIVMGAVLAGMRWLASPARLRRQPCSRPAVRVLPSRAAQAISGPRRRAIGAPKLPAVIHLDAERINK